MWEPSLSSRTCLEHCLVMSAVLFILSIVNILSIFGKRQKRPLSISDYEACCKYTLFCMAYSVLELVLEFWNRLEAFATPSLLHADMVRSGFFADLRKTAVLSRSNQLKWRVSGFWNKDVNKAASFYASQKSLGLMRSSCLWRVKVQLYRALSKMRPPGCNSGKLHTNHYCCNSAPSYVFSVSVNCSNVLIIRQKCGHQGHEER